MHDVFISYSTKDKQVADATCAILERHGVQCWIAPRDIQPGVEYADALVDAIGAAKVFVLIFSSHSNASDDVRREVSTAFNRDVVVVPLRIEPVEPSGSLEYYLSGRHWLDALTPPLEAQLQRLAETVKGVLGRRDDADDDRGRGVSGVGDERRKHDRRSPPIGPLLSWGVAGLAGIALAALAVLAGPKLFSPRPATPAVDPQRLAACQTLYNQNAAMRSRGAAFAIGDVGARQRAIATLIASGRTAESLYDVALGDATTPVGDYAAVSHYWETFGACIDQHVLDYDQVSEQVAFPDDFWNGTRGLRRLFGANWHGQGQGIPDFMSSFRQLCQTYKEARAQRPQADPLDCSA